MKIALLQCNTVTGDVAGKDCVLVDDIVDSGWTLTVASALLRQAGCAAVWPVALAATSAGD